MALEEIHGRLCLAAANLLDNYLPESPFREQIYESIERGANLSIQVDAPRLKGEGFRVYLVLARGVERHIIASIDPISCVP